MSLEWRALMPFRQQIARPRRYSRCLLLVAIIGALSMHIGAQQPKATDAVYSDAQAARGEALYGKYCRGCHSGSLTGTEFAPSITSAEFKTRWQTRSAREL